MSGRLELLHCGRSRYMRRHVWSSELVKNEPLFVAIAVYTVLTGVKTDKIP
jgi:hypothetical protein